MIIKRTRLETERICKKSLFSNTCNKILIAQQNLSDIKYIGNKLNIYI